MSLRHHVNAAGETAHVSSDTPNCVTCGGFRHRTCAVASCHCVYHITRPSKDATCPSAYQVLLLHARDRRCCPLANAPAYQCGRGKRRVCAAARSSAHHRLWPMRNAGAIAHYINGGACEQRPARLRNFAVAACALDAIARCQYAVISTRLSKGGARVHNTLDSRTICCGRV